MEKLEEVLLHITGLQAGLESYYQQQREGHLKFQRALSLLIVTLQGSEELKNLVEPKQHTLRQMLEEMGRTRPELETVTQELLEAYEQLRQLGIDIVPFKDMQMLLNHQKLMEELLETKYDLKSKYTTEIQQLQLGVTEMDKQGQEKQDRLTQLSEDIKEREVLLKELQQEIETYEQHITEQRQLHEQLEEEIRTQRDSFEQEMAERKQVIEDTALKAVNEQIKAKEKELQALTGEHEELAKKCEQMKLVEAGLKLNIDRYTQKSKELEKEIKTETERYAKLQKEQRNELNRIKSELAEIELEKLNKKKEK